MPPEGYQPYPGGHLLAYDMATGKFDDLAIAPRREGILSMNMDTARGRIFGLTWPTGRFFRFDLARSDLKDFGPVRELGESGRGAHYRTICRSIAVDPGRWLGVFHRLGGDDPSLPARDRRRRDRAGR